MQKEACRVISVCNQKGGVSKSTTVLNLGIGLAREGKKVLIIDNDPQGSLTASLGYGEPDDISVTLATIMTAVINEEEIHPEDGILLTMVDGRCLRQLLLLLVPVYPLHPL